jgi:hypothetical protein
LHKQQGSLLAYTTTTATRQDLALSAYKPDAYLEEAFGLSQPMRMACGLLFRSHTAALQVADVAGDRINVIAERRDMCCSTDWSGFNVQRGYPVPMSSSEFHAGLRQKFPERDGMYFFRIKFAEYEKNSPSVQGLEQLSVIRQRREECNSVGAPKVGG